MDLILDVLASMHHHYPSRLQMWSCNLQLYPGCDAGELTEGVTL